MKLVHLLCCLLGTDWLVTRCCGFNISGNQVGSLIFFAARLIGCLDSKLSWNSYSTLFSEDGCTSGVCVVLSSSSAVTHSWFGKYGLAMRDFAVVLGSIGPREALRWRRFWQRWKLKHRYLYCSTRFSTNDRVVSVTTFQVQHYELEAPLRIR